MRSPSLVRASVLLQLVFVLTLSWPVHAQQPYMNEAHLFVITPPSGWTINERAGTTIVQFELRLADTVAAINVVTSNKEGVSLIDVVSSSKKELQAAFRDFKSVSEGPVRVASVDGYEIVYTFRYDSLTFKTKQVLVCRYTYKFYIITYLTADASYERYLGEADRCIASFGFAEKLTIDTEPRVATIAMDGKSYSSGDLPKTLLVVIGQTYSLSVESEIPGHPGTRYVFVEWNDGLKETSRKISPARAESFKAKYKTQHRLTVESEYGITSGGGWYDAGATATFFVTSQVPISGFMGTLGARMVFDRWSGDSSLAKESATISMESPKKVVAVWREDYTQAYIVLVVLVAGAVAVIFGLLMKTRKPSTRIASQS